MPREKENASVSPKATGQQRSFLDECRVLAAPRPSGQLGAGGAAITVGAASDPAAPELPQAGRGSKSAGSMGDPVVLHRCPGPFQRKNYDGYDYPPSGAELGPPTHSLREIPVVCRVHLGVEPDFRWEILRCKQPDGDGLIGWAVVNDNCYLAIVRERGVVRTLVVPNMFTTDHLRECQP